MKNLKSNNGAIVSVGDECTAHFENCVLIGNVKNEYQGIGIYISEEGPKLQMYDVLVVVDISHLNIWQKLKICWKFIIKRK